MLVLIFKIKLLSVLKRKEKKKDNFTEIGSEKTILFEIELSYSYHKG